MIICSPKAKRSHHRANSKAINNHRVLLHSYSTLETMSPNRKGHSILRAISSSLRRETESGCESAEARNKNGKNPRDRHLLPYVLVRNFDVASTSGTYSA